MTSFKKQRDVEGTGSTSFLVPVKTLGQVVNGQVYPSLYHRGGMWFSAVVSGESSFNIVALDTLQTVFQVTANDREIKAVASKDDLTLVSCVTEEDDKKSSGLILHERSDVLWTVDTDTLQQYLLIFEDIFISVSECGQVTVRSVKDGSVINQFQTGRPAQVSLVIHPNTFMNKILVGYADGLMQLWNVKTSELIHTFKSLGHSIASVSQSPEVDVAAVGLSDGTVVVLNLKTEEEYGRVKCSSPVTCVAVRHDNPPEDFQLMTAEENGTITIWSISKQARPLCILPKAHRGPVLRCSFLTGQPIIVSFGREDNAIKEWIVEAEGRELRLLRSREGSNGPIRSISYFRTEAHGEELVVCDEDSVISMSTGSLDTKLQRIKVKGDADIKGLSLFDENPNLNWDDGVCWFEGSSAVKTISKRKNANGKHTILQAANGKYVCDARMSFCGHFCVAATSDGVLSVANVQSGKVKQEFKVSEGIPVFASFDSVSRHVLAVTKSGEIFKFSMAKKQLVAIVKLAQNVRKAFYKRESDLLYVLLEDYAIIVVDLNSEKTVRILESAAVVNDFCVSPNSKWLVACSLDSILLWDLISGVMIAEHPVKNTINRIVFSPSGEFVSTASIGCNYAEMWWFLPINAVSRSSVRSMAYMMTDAPEEGELLFSMSRGNLSRLTSFVEWQSLREQNKPKVPLKKSTAAPFFLTELAAASLLKKTDDLTVNDTKETENPENDKKLNLSADSSDLEIEGFLLEADPGQVHDEFALADAQLLERVFSVLGNLVQNRNHFDRLLVVLAVLSKYHSKMHKLEPVIMKMHEMWAPSEDRLHASLNAIRFTRNQHHQH